MNTKLAEILNSFSSKELNELGKFLGSPYFNNNTKILQLYDILKKNVKAYSVLSLSKEKLFAKVFPGEKFSLKKLELLISGFVKKSNLFLALNFINKDDTVMKLAMIRKLREKKLTKNFNSEAGKLRKILMNKKARNIEDYLNLSLTEQEIIISDQYKFFLSKNTSYQNSIDNLDYYFILKKLTQAVFILNHKNEVGSELKYELRFLREIIYFVKQNITEIKRKHPVLYCYYLIILTLENPMRQENYAELKDYVLLNAGKIEEKLLWEILIEMENYSDSMVKVNREKYVREVFEIYMILEKRRYFKNQSFINHFDFLNTVTTGLLLGNHRWAQKFINLYKNKLPKDFRNITLNLVNAEMEFFKKNYRSALGYLNNLNYDNYYFYLRIKVLTAKIYYEMNELEALIYVIDAMKHYLRRHEKILGRYIGNTRNFIFYINYLMKFKQKPRNDLAVVKEKIMRRSDLISKEWVLEKIEELDKGS